MLRSFLLRGLAVGFAFFGLTWPGLAQSDDQERPAGYSAIIDSIDVLVDNYAGFLARKYDLTEEQDAYTKSLLRERSYEFLDRHEEELRVLVDRMFDVRTGGEMTAEELIEWGQRVRPVYEEAKRLVTDGNNEWREILTAQQKKIHDEDLALMHQSFETTEDQLDRIVSGEMTVDEFRSPKRARQRPSRPKASRTLPPRDEPRVAREAPPPERPQRLSPPAPGERPEPPADQAGRHVTRPEPDEVRPPARRATQPRAEPLRDEAKPGASKRHEAPPRDVATKAGDKAPEGAWEKYVREFIETYKLNDEQSQKAHAVLEDCKSQRDRYLRGHKGQIEQLDKQLEELKKSKDKKRASQLSALSAKRNQLMEPMERIFEQQLKPRLERLPTRAQRRAAEAAAKKPATKKPSKP